MQRSVTFAFAFLLISSLACAAENTPKPSIHVFVALADNQHQGIVPVPAKLGNGLDPEHNLYWGAAGGVKTFFARSAKWKLLGCGNGLKSQVLQRCRFQHRASGIELIADAYRGDEIAQAITDFFYAAAGSSSGAGPSPSPVHDQANVVVYVGHDGLMDFRLPLAISKQDEVRRNAIILACASRQYFRELLSASGAYPLLWTNGLMAPEAYTLESALDAWIEGKTNQEIHESAAVAYDKYQKCGLRGARKLFATGW